MTAVLAHRGPDGEGFFEAPDMPVFLGHRRLAILDIAGGQQPMWNEDGRIAVVFNGEIYNHAALRAELERAGHRFHSSHSDTEVLVHGYEEWGSDLPARLNGMFALAVLDVTRRRLFLARDRFGEKPLYYFHRRGLFAFASELSALIQHREIEAAIDPAALQKYFAYGYLPAPNALYRGCRKLPGGHHATFGIDVDRLTIERYWRFRLEPDHSLGDRDAPRLAEELRHLIIQAVGRRLESDVPIGLFLSGGIDSSSVVAGAVRHRSAGTIDTFTIGFTEPSFDESAHAKAIAHGFGTRHHEAILDLETARDDIPELLARLDEPMGDASLLPSALLSRFTRRHVTVALSGDGGDELFAGYDPFQALRLAEGYARLVPARLHAGFRRLADFLPISTANMSFDFKLRRALTGLSYPQAVWNPVWMSPVEPGDMKDLFYEPLRTDDLYSEAINSWNANPTADPVDRTLEFFTNLYLPDDILVKADRAAMMASLETRAIFLDNDVVDFCQRLPNRFKFHKGRRKVLLKEAMTGLLPREVIGRRKKGFGIPLAKWLRSVPPVPPLRAVPGMRQAAIERRWREHRAGRADHRLFLWNWLALQYGWAVPRREQRGAA